MEEDGPRHGRLALGEVPKSPGRHLGNQTAADGLDTRRTALSVNGSELSKHLAGLQSAKGHCLSRGRIDDDFDLTVDNEKNVVRRVLITDDFGTWRDLTPAAAPCDVRESFAGKLSQRSNADERFLVHHSVGSTRSSSHISSARVANDAGALTFAFAWPTSPSLQTQQPEAHHRLPQALESERANGLGFD